MERLGGSPMLQSGGEKSEVAHKWAQWLHNLCRLRGPTGQGLVGVRDPPLFWVGTSKKK